MRLLILPILAIAIATVRTASATDADPKEMVMEHVDWKLAWKAAAESAVGIPERAKAAIARGEATTWVGKEAVGVLPSPVPDYVKPGPCSVLPIVEETLEVRERGAGAAGEAYTLKPVLILPGNCTAESQRGDGVTQPWPTVFFFDGFSVRGGGGGGQEKKSCDKKSGVAACGRRRGERATAQKKKTPPIKTRSPPNSIIPTPSTWRLMATPSPCTATRSASTSFPTA